MAEQYAGLQRIGFIQQADWATPGTVASTFQLLNYDKGVTISDPDIQIDQQNFINQRGIINEAERTFVDDLSGLPSMNFSGVATRSVLAPHFVAALQEVTEGATTPYEKVIRSAFKAGVIDWSADAGYLWTLGEERYSDAVDDTDINILTNALLDNFQFTVEPNNRGIARLAKISGTWRGKSMTHIDDGTTLTGSPVAMPTTNFYNDATKFTLNIGTIGSFDDICFKRFTLRIENNLTSDCRGTGGAANNFKASPKYFAEIDLPYLAAYNHFTANFIEGTGVSFDLEAGSVGVTGHIKIDCDSGVIIQNPFGFDGEYMSRPLIIELVSTVDDDQTPIEVTISDAVDWAYV